MKKFSLGCEYDHEFEGWFADADAIRQQLQAGLLDCPYCGSTNLEKRLSSPNLSTPKTRARIREQEQDALPPAADSISASESVAATGPSAALAPSVGQGGAALRNAVRALHQKIQAEFTNVGDKFAEEARKIHYGESEAEGIYGQATQEERDSLKDEGIEIYDMPWVPPDH